MKLYITAGSPYARIVRTTKRLERALHRIQLLRGEIDDYYANFRVAIQTRGTRSQARGSSVLRAGSLKRS